MNSAQSLSEPKRQRVGWATGICLAILVASNVVANRVLPNWAFVPWNCVIALVLIVVATRVGGRTLSELGLARNAVRSGVRWGLPFAAGILALYSAAALVPATRGLFQDQRIDSSLAGVLAQAFLWVPLGTVLLEEVAFRGVLPALFGVRLGRFRANGVSALLFGLWHVLPAWKINSANPVFREALPGTPGQITAIVLGVIGTAVAGLFLSFLRDRSNSLIAPITVHISTNGFGYLVGWVVQHIG
ncbi:MAG: CPBP family intramembrane glutamic endopeptidase [Acidimicrobiia bacterium]